MTGPYIIWTQLSLLYKAFWLLLFSVSAYLLLSMAGVWVRLRSRKSQREGDTTSSRRSLANAEDRLGNVSQFISAAAYAFAFLFCTQLPHDIWIYGFGLSSGMSIWGTASLQLAFGAYVFLVLLVLHLSQWWLSARVSAARRHVDE